MILAQRYALLIFLSRLLMLVICFYPTTESAAQNYIDLATTEFTQTQDNDFENSERSSRLNKYSFNATAPIPMGVKNTFLTGLVYDRLSSEFSSDEEREQVSAFTLKLGMNIKLKEKWSASFLLLPKLASSFANKVNIEDFQFGIVALAKFTKSKNLAYKFGTYFNTDRFGPFLVPLFGLYFQKDKLEIDIVAPSYAKLNYNLLEQLTAGVNWRATVRSYNFVTRGDVTSESPDLYLHHLSNEVGVHLGYEPIKGFILRGIVGLSMARSFRLYETDSKIDFGLSLFRFGDERVQLNKDYDDGAFGRLELVYRYYLK